MTPVLSALASGFGMMMGLIVAIGAQNSFILKQGLIKSHVRLIVALAISIDSALIVFGAFGFGSWISGSPILLRTISAGGAVFLIWYGVAALRKAFYTDGLTLTETSIISPVAAVRTVIAVSFLNPHVYLDTVVLVGAYAAQYTGIDRLSFTIGAIGASCLWFVALGYGARLLIPLFQKRASWIILDIMIAAMMFYISWGFIKIALG